MVKWNEWEKCLVGEERADEARCDVLFWNVKGLNKKEKDF